MEITNTKPDDFIKSLPLEHRDDIATLDKLIVSVDPKQSRVMWEGKFWGGTDQKIIGYKNVVFRAGTKKRS